MVTDPDPNDVPTGLLGCRGVDVRRSARVRSVTRRPKPFRWLPGPNRSLRRGSMGGFGGGSGAFLAKLTAADSSREGTPRQPGAYYGATRGPARENGGLRASLGRASDPSVLILVLHRPWGWVLIEPRT